MAKPTDHELDGEVAMMLRVGVSLAALIVCAGGVLLLVEHPAAIPPDFTHFHGNSSSLRSFGLIFTEAMHLTPRGLIQLGLLVLIATPVARVMVCVVDFARQRNALYVVISALVLTVLAYSFLRSGA